MPKMVGPSLVVASVGPPSAVSLALLPQPGTNPAVNATAASIVQIVFAIFIRILPFKS
jgi:hypothetical protein